MLGEKDMIFSESFKLNCKSIVAQLFVVISFVKCSGHIPRGHWAYLIGKESVFKPVMTDTLLSFDVGFEHKINKNMNK